jgi:hypothetical protein
VSRNAPQDEEVGQHVDHIDRLELAGNTDRQAFMGELVEHVEHPILASIVGAFLDKVVARLRCSGRSRMPASGMVDKRVIKR